MRIGHQGRVVAAAAAVGLLQAFVGPALAQTEAGIFSFDPAASDIHWRVYKAGAFARFGHNHVISVPAPRGRIELAETLADSRVMLEIPVLELVVDEPTLRARYGEDFSSEPSDEDIAGTRTNMLTEDVLNGERFTTLSIVGTAPTGLGEGQTIALEIHLLGRIVTVTVPVDLHVEADTITATGQFRLTHEQLGMKPFSVMMGALQVGEEMDFSYNVRAVRSANH